MRFLASLEMTRASSTSCYFDKYFEEKSLRNNWSNHYYTFFLDCHDLLIIIRKYNDDSGLSSQASDNEQMILYKILNCSDAL